MSTLDVRLSFDAHPGSNIVYVLKRCSTYLSPRPFLPQPHTLPTSTPDPPQALPASAPGSSCLSPRLFLPQPQALPASAPGSSCLSPRLFLPQPQALPASAPGSSCLSPRAFLPQPQALPASTPGLSCLSPMLFLSPTFSLVPRPYIYIKVRVKNMAW